MYFTNVYIFKLGRFQIFNLILKKYLNTLYVYRKGSFCKYCHSSVWFKHLLEITKTAYIILTPLNPNFI